MSEPLPLPDEPDFETDKDAIDERAEAKPGARASEDIVHRLKYHADDVEEALQPIRKRIDNNYDEMLRKHPDIDPITAARSSSGESSAQLAEGERLVENVQKRLSSAPPLTNQEASDLMSDLVTVLKCAEEAKPSNF
ncbi:hypothetical protein [Burkholderia glumae]